MARGKGQTVHVTDAAVLWKRTAVSAEMGPRVLKVTAPAEESLPVRSWGHGVVSLHPCVWPSTWSLQILTAGWTQNRPLSNVWPFQIALLEHARLRPRYLTPRGAAG